MPYIRMFLDNRQIDEVFISDIFLDSVLGYHFFQEEKQLMLLKHASRIKQLAMEPSFDIFPPLKNSGADI